MLQTIKSYITNLPDKDFGQFYQDYVMKMQDEIVESDAKALEAQWAGNMNTCDILSGINKLTEELNSS